MNICIYGGSFNPPHKMHKRLVNRLLSQGLADKVIVVPTGNAYKKSNLININHRLNMLNIMFKNNSSVCVSNYEDKNCQIYTYQTLDHFKQMYPADQIYLAMGSDNLKQISSWKNAEYLIKTFKFIVFLRNNDNTTELLKYAKGADIVFAKDVGECASSMVREHIKQKQDVSKFVDKNVLKYIQENNLYEEDNGN